MSLMLVTGGAGFIGSHLVARLAELGHEVRVIDNFSTGKRENLSACAGDIEVIEGDIREPDTVERAVSGAEIVFHQAALASVPRSVDDPVSSHDVNATGTLNVLVACRNAGVRRVVYASSSSVYGDSRELPKRESLTPRPESPYAAGKLAAEHYCRVFSSIYGLPCVSLRYFNVFGPRQDPSSQYAAVVPLFLKALLSDSAATIYGDGEQSRDFTYVSNVVDANILASESESPGGEVLNIACGSATTVNELFRALAAIVGSSEEPRHLEPRQGDVRHSYADVSRAGELLGYAPRVALQEGLELTADWFRAAG